METLHAAASAPLRAFAASVRDRVGGLDPAMGAWLEGAVLAADPFPSTLEAVRTLGLSHASAVAVGKAAVPMALSWQAAGGAAGLAVVPADEPVPREMAGWRIVRGEHPISGPGSLEAGRAVLEVAQSGADVVLLLSGGASAMMEAPTVDVEEHRRLSAELRAMGLPIGAWNAARALLSRLKSGGLAGVVAAAGGELFVLYASDVPGDDPAVVGSGPGHPRDLDGLLEAVPGPLRARLERAGARRGEPGTAAVTRCVVPRGAPAKEAARRVTADGWRARVVDPLDTEVEEAARSVERAWAVSTPDEVLVVWGEPLVRLPPKPGPGGRTSVLMARLWASGALAGALGALVATDGLDGASGLGGCYARFSPPGQAGAGAALTRWRTGDFFVALPGGDGGGVPAARTGANCADVGLLRRPP